MTLDQAIEQSVLGAIAKLFRPVGSAEVVNQVPPLWIRAAQAEALFGIHRHTLKKLAASGKVVCKKLDGVIVFKFADIVASVEEAPEVKP